MVSVIILLNQGADSEKVLRSLEDSGLENIKFRLNRIVGEIELDKIDFLKEINGVSLVELNHPLGQ